MEKPNLTYIQKETLLINIKPCHVRVYVCVGVPCTDRTYKCADGTCVKKQNPACDFTADCPDASDEKNCSETPFLHKNK